jgi:hypothetical protein
VASQNGGHQSSQLPPTIPATATSPSILQVNMFFPDALAVRDWAYNSIDVTTQTAKFLIDAYYGRRPDRSYFVGCSTSGRQGMAMSQLFPAHYDGVIAGDPFYLPPDISLSETWGLEQIISVSPKDASGNPLYLQGFPLSDQQLFTNAILAACDAQDGLVDGVIDNAAACTFDPATFVFPASGPYGAIAPGAPLQCAGAKTPPASVRRKSRRSRKLPQVRGRRLASGSLRPMERRCPAIRSTAASCSRLEFRRATSVPRRRRPAISVSARVSFRCSGSRRRTRITIR